MSPSNTTHHLTYFAVPGRAELIRLLFAYGNLPLEQTQFTLEEYTAAKPTLCLPYGQLPVISVDGKIFAQSLAIARYTAKLVGLYPEDPLAALEVDGIIDAIADLLLPIFNAIYSESDEAIRATKLQRINSTVLPRGLAFLEQQVHGHISVGTERTVADLSILDFYDNVLNAFPGQITVDTTPYPKLTAIAEGLRKSDRLQAYYAAKA
ncbi:glutathione S-transferase [Achlya hypogyna]|uniref:Glutathione S-transferase n=1 Tax=Achlya hypogyna TaxID=1202772 RepID=A0A1V9ZCV5_ACHHY|nr:glutathione S-transferase [Achlya hypogyna]